MAALTRGKVPNWVGDGSGYGYGSGYGHGSGSGYGSGSGHGSGSGYYWAKTIKYFSEKWPVAQRKRLYALKKSGAKIAFWRSNSRGRACNGGNNVAVAPGTIETAPGPLRLCKNGSLHATLLPPEWKGERWWIVALIGEVVGDDGKYAALKREIIGEAT